MMRKFFPIENYYIWIAIYYIYKFNIRKYCQQEENILKLNKSVKRLRFDIYIKGINVTTFSSSINMMFVSD